MVWQLKYFHDLYLRSASLFYAIVYVYILAIAEMLRCAGALRLDNRKVFRCPGCKVSLVLLFFFVLWISTRLAPQNGRVSFRCTGNEAFSTLYSAALMILPVPTNWCTRNLLILSQSYLATGTPTNVLDRCIQQFLNRKHGVTRQRDLAAETSPSPKYCIFHYNYRIWVLYPTTYGRNSAVV